jgi:hypothetical protein
MPVNFVPGLALLTLRSFQAAQRQKKIQYALINLTLPKWGSNGELKIVKYLALNYLPEKHTLQSKRGIDKGAARIKYRQHQASGIRHQA